MTLGTTHHPDSTHTPLPTLCPFPKGGQKVKLVLAAAMWNSPHLLIMDEPTNYLDRCGPEIGGFGPRV